MQKNCLAQRNQSENASSQSAQETRVLNAADAKADGQVALVGFELQFPAMGTLVQLKTFARSESEVERGFNAAQRRVLEIANTLTDYDPESETRQLSQLAVESPQNVSADLWAVLTASDDWYRRTDGHFDSSLGSLTRLWRKYRRVRRVPNSEAVQTALQNSGWKYVRLDPSAKTLKFARANVFLDFGGIGKGYIVDEAFRVLVEHDLPQSLVNISGNMRMGTAPPNRNGWNIEVAPIEANPKSEKEGAAGEPLQRLELCDCSIATSGDLWQYIEINGVRHSHILDPQTGYGVPGPISATVIAQRAMDADALATAACILPKAKAITLCQNSDAACLVARRVGKELQVDRSTTFPQPPNEPPTAEGTDPSNVPN
ncbi:MAG: FAD:protein FMN transferase [Aureliella sp.]